MCMVSLIFKGLIDLQRSMFIQIGDSVTQKQTQILAAIIQSVLNFILIFGLKLHLIGAAITCTITNMSIFFVNERYLSKTQASDMEGFEFSVADTRLLRVGLKSYLHQAWPAVLQYVLI